MSQPANLQMRDCDVCVDCDNRVALTCRRHDIPIHWNLMRYGCGDYWPRDNIGGESDE